MKLIDSVIIMETNKFIRKCKTYPVKYYFL